MSVPDDGFRYPPAEEALRQSAIGRVCRIVEPYDGTSKDNLKTESGHVRLHYAALSADGIAGYSFYARPRDLELLQATEDMLLLYSDDLWQLLRPFGEHQDAPTFAKLATTFGLI